MAPYKIRNFQFVASGGSSFVVDSGDGKCGVGNRTSRL